MNELSWITSFDGPFISPFSCKRSCRATLTPWVIDWSQCFMFLVIWYIKKNCFEHCYRTSQWRVGRHSPTPMNCNGKCNPLWVELHFWQTIIVSGGKTLKTLVSWLMKKGHFSSSILRWPAESRDSGCRGCQLSCLIPLFPPQQSNGGFNPFPQVETISSLMSLSFCFSLSDGQAAWGIMEGSQTGQRWLSGIIPLWNPPPLLK